MHEIALTRPMSKNMVQEMTIPGPTGVEAVQETALPGPAAEVTVEVTQEVALLETDTKVLRRRW